MPIPTVTKLNAELEFFINLNNSYIKPEAINLQQILQSITNNQCSTEEADALFNRLFKTNYKKKFKKVYNNKLTFFKVINHVFLYYANRYPRNDLNEQNQIMDPIGLDVIPEAFLFIDSDRKHWNAKHLIHWANTKGRFEHPITHEEFSRYAIEKIKKIGDPELFNAIKNLSSKDNHLVFASLDYLINRRYIHQDIIAPLLKCLKNSDENIIIHTFIMFSLLKEVRNKVIQLREIANDGLGDLIRLLASQNEVLIILDLDLLLQLGTHFTNFAEFVKNTNLISKLILLLKNYDHKNITDGCLRLLQITCNKHNQDVFNREGGIDLLIRLLPNKPPSMQVPLLVTLHHLLIDNEANQNSFFNANGLICLIYILQNSNELVMPELANILLDLAANHTTALRQPGLIECFIKLLKSTDEFVLLSILSALSYMSLNNPTIQEDIYIHTDRFSLLVPLLNHTNISIILATTLIFANLGRTPQQIQAISQAGGITRIADLLHSDDESTVITCAHILTKMLLKIPASDYDTVMPNIMPQIIGLLRNSIFIIKTTLKYLFEISQKSREHLEVLRIHGAIPVLLELCATSNDEEISKPVFKLLTRLIANPEGRNFIAAYSNISILNFGFQVLSNNDCNKRKLARDLIDHINLAQLSTDVESDILQELQFTAFLRDILTKIINLSRFLTNPDQRKQKQERLNHYIDFFMALFNAKNILLTNQNYPAFKKACNIAIEEIKPFSGIYEMSFFVPYPRNTLNRILVFQNKLDLVGHNLEIASPNQIH